MQRLDFSHRRNEWTAEEDDILAKMANEGATAREIGERLGRPRNSVIGRRNRLKSGIIFKGNRSKPVRKGKVSQLASRTRSTPIVCTPVADGVGVRFINTTERSCMWFLEGQAGANGYVCGDTKVHGHSYCAAHLLAAYDAGSSAQRAA